MQTFTTILAASALIASVTGTPLKARSTCGATPTGSGSQTPLAQPTGITTAKLCKAQCDANPSCQAFVFGLVDGALAPTCILYSVPAAQVPKQSSANLIVYDKACASVPAVVPTASNPTGHARKLAARDTCGAAPTGTGSQAPLETPSGVTTAAACQAKCAANTSCKSFCFGLVDSAPKCILFSVPAAQVPKQSSANLIAYDKACSAVPAVVPTASNPTGVATTANTGSNTNTGATTSNNTPAKSAAHKRSICGAAPTGPSGNASPIATPSNIADLDACRAACLANPSCKAFEFGVFVAGGAKECHLFAVAASAVPAPTSGQSVVIYDVACSL